MGHADLYHGRLRDQSKRIKRLSEEHAVACGLTPGQVFLHLSVALSRVSRRFKEGDEGFLSAWLVESFKTLQQLKKGRLTQPTPPAPPIIIKGDFRSTADVEAEIARRLNEERRKRETTRRTYGKVFGLTEQDPFERYEAKARLLGVRL